MLNDLWTGEHHTDELSSKEHAIGGNGTADNNVHHIDADVLCLNEANELSDRVPSLRLVQDGRQRRRGMVCQP